MSNNIDSLKNGCLIGYAISKGAKGHLNENKETRVTKPATQAAASTWQTADDKLLGKIIESVSKHDLRLIDEDADAWTNFSILVKSHRNQAAASQDSIRRRLDNLRQANGASISDF
ncbi:hypothetical protein HDU92_000509, partial [Lobulomyces angularis]